jgi:hypothetical protein
MATAPVMMMAVAVANRAGVTVASPISAQYSTPGVWLSSTQPRNSKYSRSIPKYRRRRCRWRYTIVTWNALSVERMRLRARQALSGPHPGQPHQVGILLLDLCGNPELCYTQTCVGLPQNYDEMGSE